MSRFAKLFERDGEQALVTLSDRDAVPAVSVEFRDDEASATPMFVFRPKDDSDEAMVAARHAAQAMFDLVSEDRAFKLRDKCMKLARKVTG